MFASRDATSFPSFRHGESYPRGGTTRDAGPRRGADDARRDGGERLARAAPLQAGVQGGAARLVRHARCSLAGRRPADLVYGGEQAVLGQALEVSGSTGGLVNARGTRSSPGSRERESRGEQRKIARIMHARCVPIRIQAASSSQVRRVSARRDLNL